MSTYVIYNWKELKGSSTRNNLGQYVEITDVTENNIEITTTIDKKRKTSELHIRNIIIDDSEERFKGGVNRVILELLFEGFRVIFKNNMNAEKLTDKQKIELKYMRTVLGFKFIANKDDKYYAFMSDDNVRAIKYLTEDYSNIFGLDKYLPIKSLITI